MPRKTAAEAPVTATSKPRNEPAAKPAATHDEIALRAYHIYLRRNGAPGNPFDDWKQAEHELLAAATAKPKSRSRKSKIITFAA